MKMKMKRMKMRRSRLHMLYMPLIKQASPVFPARTAMFSCERIVTWGLLRMVDGVAYSDFLEVSLLDARLPHIHHLPTIT
jgi:hypothetical protein